MIRLVATDLDGTLLEPDGTLPEGIFRAIEQLTDLGVHFAACSGRQLGNLRRLFAPVADRMDFVCENGALCAVGGEVTDVVAIAQADAREAIADILAAGMNLLVSGRHTCYVIDDNRHYTDDIIYRLRNTITVVSSADDITEPMLKISGQTDEPLQPIAERFLQKWTGRLTATVSGNDWFDFTAANKGMGMHCLMKRLGVTPQEAMCFGDNFNDETMLDSVAYPFLMQHAAPALRKPHYRLCPKVLPVLQQLVQNQGQWP